MKEKIHGTTRHERRKEREGNPEQSPGNEAENRYERRKCRSPSLNELLHVPAFGNVVVFFYFRFPTVQTFPFVHRNHVAVSRTGRGEPLTENRILPKAFQSRNHPFEVPLGRSFAQDDAVHAVFELHVKREGEYRHERNRDESGFAVFFPNEPGRHRQKSSDAERHAD